MHGPVIPGPGGEKPRWMPQVALSSLFSPLVPCGRSRVVEGIQALLRDKNTHRETHTDTHTQEKRELLRLVHSVGISDGEPNPVRSLKG